MFCHLPILVSETYTIVIFIELFLFVCLRIVVFNTYCVVFLFYFSLSCVPYAARDSELFIVIAPSVFSNVYVHLFAKLLNHGYKK